MSADFLLPRVSHVAAACLAARLAVDLHHTLDGKGLVYVPRPLARIARYVPQWARQAVADMGYRVLA